MALIARSLESASFILQRDPFPRHSNKTLREHAGLGRRMGLCKAVLRTKPSKLGGSGCLRGNDGALCTTVCKERPLDRGFQSRGVSCCSLHDSASKHPSTAIFMEIDGVMSELHDGIHRVSFNAAFEELGLCCYRWNGNMYRDLLRVGQGSPTGMLRAYFQMVGFPLTTRAVDEAEFIEQVLIQKDIAAAALVKKGGITLKDGVQSFLEDAHAKGVPVLLVHPGDMPLGEEVAQAILAQLPAKLTDGPWGVRSGVSNAIREPPSAAAAFTAAAGDAIKAAKRTAAASAASVLDDVVVDLAHLERSSHWLPVLRSAMESLELPPENCCLVAGGNAGVQAALSLGMPAVVVKSSLTSAGEFPGCLATFDGFGPGGGVTLQKIEPLLKSAC